MKYSQIQAHMPCIHAHSELIHFSCYTTYILSLRNTVNNSEPGDVVPRAVLRKYQVPGSILRTERAIFTIISKSVPEWFGSCAARVKWTSEGLQTRSTDAGVVSTQRDSTNLDTDPFHLKKIRNTRIAITIKEVERWTVCREEFKHVPDLVLGREYRATCTY